MNQSDIGRRRADARVRHSVGSLSAFLVLAALTQSASGGRTAAAQTPGAQKSAAKAPDAGAEDSKENEGTAAAVSLTSSPEERTKEAWAILTGAVHDAKHTQTRIQGLAAVGLLSNERAESLMQDGMADPDLDVRTAAVMAAGQSKDRNLTTPLRKMLDDREPQVVFTAATTLWKMGDRSGEDILMAVVDGERSAGPTLLHGTEHDLNKDLHDPVGLAKMGAMQGASMLLGPFGYGITAYEYIRRSGGDLSRVSAIEQLAQARTEPIHQELIAALGDKDPAVRAASSKALVEYRDRKTAMAIYELFADAKQPVRLTAAAAYLRTVGIPGPSIERPVGSAAAPRAGH